MKTTIRRIFAMLQKTKTRAITCKDLAKGSRWDTSLCCKECHHGGHENLILELITARNPLQGRREALLCCRCVSLLDDWYQGICAPPVHVNTEYCWVHEGPSHGGWTCQHDDCLG